MGENTSLEFPQTGDLVNFTRRDSETPPARVTIPQEFLQESLDEEIEGVLFLFVSPSIGLMYATIERIYEMYFA